MKTLKEEIFEVKRELDKEKEKLRPLQKTYKDLTKHFDKRFQEYYKAINGNDYKYYFDDEVYHGFTLEEDKIIMYYRPYDEHYEDPTEYDFDWKFVEMSNEEFKDWVEEEKENQRLLQEARDMADEDEQRKLRKKQWEELNKEFGDAETN